jgi:hypothetical protein
MSFLDFVGKDALLTTPDGVCTTAAGERNNGRRIPSRCNPSLGVPMHTYLIGSSPSPLNPLIPEIDPPRVPQKTCINPRIPMAVFSKFLDVSVGVVFCSVLVYLLNIYISWVPELDIYLFTIIIILNSAQLVL